MLDRHSETQLDKIYSALSSSTRREILRLLEGGPQSVTEIVESSSLSRVGAEITSHYRRSV